MSDSLHDQAQKELLPSRQKARTLIEELAAKGEETQQAAGYQQAQAFLDSIWQGKAVSRIPSQPKPDKPEAQDPQQE